MQKDIIDFTFDEKVEGFYLVKTAEKRTDKQGSAYLDMIICDRTGDINGKLWKTRLEAPQSGSIVYIRGQIREFSGKLQLNIDSFRYAEETDGVDITTLVKSAPRQPKEMFLELADYVNKFQNPVLKTLILSILKDSKEKLSYYPAAQNMHHAERSGLLSHIISMLNVARRLSEHYAFLDQELLYSGVILHDLGKLDELISNEYGVVSEYSKSGNLVGHLVGGVAKLRQVAKENDIEEENEYLLLLEHMIISHHEKAEYGSPKPPMFPEAIMLHYIDDMDAKMYVLQEVLQRVPRGAFSEKVFSLDRKVYHPEYLDETK